MPNRNQISDAGRGFENSAQSSVFSAEVVSFPAGAELPGLKTSARDLSFLLNGRISLNDGWAKPVLEYAVFAGEPLLLPCVLSPSDTSSLLALRAETDVDVLNITDAEHNAWMVNSDRFRRFTLDAHARLVKDLRAAQEQMVLAQRGISTCRRCLH